MANVEALKEVIGKLLKTNYRIGLAQGSKSEVFVNGEVYSVHDLSEAYREQDAEAGRLLSELQARSAHPEGEGGE